MSASDHLSSWQLLPAQPRSTGWEGNLFSVIVKVYPGLARHITGMILTLDNSEIMQLLSLEDKLINKASEMAALLEAAGFEQGGIAARSCASEVAIGEARPFLAPTRVASAEALPQPDAVVGGWQPQTGDCTGLVTPPSLLDSSPLPQEVAPLQSRIIGDMEKYRQA